MNIPQVADTIKEHWSAVTSDPVFALKVSCVALTFALLVLLLAVLLRRRTPVPRRKAVRRYGI